MRREVDEPARRRATSSSALWLVGGVVAILLATSFAPKPVHASGICTGWTSDTSPPPSIRVLRTTGPAEGTVEVVPFRDYVATVLPAEWSDGPAAAVQAGAIAVKQYAWYWTMHWRGHTAADGACYDVVDSTIDQVYSPETQQPTQGDLAAIAASWPVTLTHAGQFFPTGYREGSDVPCGADADGELLYQVSLYRCAAAGMTFDALLHRYLDPGLQILSGSPPPPRPGLSIMAASPVIQWGRTAMFTLQLTGPAVGHASLAKRDVRLDSSQDGLVWSSVATATSDAKGIARVRYRPVTNLWYRAAFDSTSDLGAAVSPTIRLVVRQLAILRPDARGAVLTVRAGAPIALTVTVRPARAGLRAGVVVVQLWRMAHGVFTFSRSFRRTPDPTGKATLTLRLTAGSWEVRSRATPTTVSADSVWTPMQRVEVH